MEIAILGAGSIGMLMASFLSEYNDRVTLIVRREEQARNLQEHGLTRRNLDGSIFQSKVNVKRDFTNLEQDSLIIIALKYGKLAEVFEELQQLNPKIPLLFLQNGLAHLDEADCLPQHTIAFGSCQFGAERENDSTVLHRGHGVLKIAVEKGEIDQFNLFTESPNPLFQVKFEESAENMLFEKALLNCFINPLTAVLEVTNGKLIENPQTLLLLKNLYNELMTAFPEEEARVTFSDVENLCKRTAANTSSMLSDILNSRNTEIETIVGAVLKRAAKKGKSLPILQTLYFLVLAKEGSGEKM